MAIPSRSFFRILVFVVAILTVGGTGAILTANRDASAQSADGNADDTQTEGQVVAMNSLGPRPMVQIVNINGNVTLYFTNAGKLAESGVRFGDYVLIVGRKLNDFEYEVDTLRVDSRAATNHTTRSVADPYGDATTEDGYAEDDYGEDYSEDEYSEDDYAEDDYGDDNYGYDDYGDEEPTPTTTPRRTGASR